MFTGLVEAVGHVAAVEREGADRRLRIEPGAAMMADLRPGDSVSVAGACLTAVAPDATGFWTDVSAETLAHTTLGERGAGDAVNLERALLPTSRLGGHFVAGHVDGVGAVEACSADGRSRRYRIRVPQALARYVAPKGSICVDGISLTINEVEGAVFGVNIIPHTLDATTLGSTGAGARVNIEVDVVARYVERLLASTEAPASRVTREQLARTGFPGGEG